MKLLKDFFFLKLIGEKNWFLCYSYNPSENNILSHLHVISKALDELSKKYVILLGYFGNEPEEKSVKFPKHLQFEKYCRLTQIERTVSN